MLTFSIAALIFATLFSGAALYITLVEHPARLILEDGPLLAQWQPSYKRALPIQSGLAIAAGVSGLVAWYLSRDSQWLVGSLVILANWPFTLLAIFPVNKRLMSMRHQDAGPESRAMLLKWGNLHNARSALGVLAVALFVWGFAATG